VVVADPLALLVLVRRPILILDLPVRINRHIIRNMLRKTLNLWHNSSFIFFSFTNLTPSSLIPTLGGLWLMGCHHLLICHSCNDSERARNRTPSADCKRVPPVPLESDSAQNSRNPFSFPLAIHQEFFIIARARLVRPLQSFSPTPPSNA